MSKSPEEIQAEIEQQRAQLAETVDQLTHKLDVKANTKAKVEDVKAQTQAKVEDVRVQTQAKVEEVKVQTQAVVEDVRAQTQLKVAEVKALSTTDDGKPRPEVLGVAAAVVLGVGLLIWLRRRR